MRLVELHEFELHLPLAFARFVLLVLPADGLHLGGELLHLVHRDHALALKRMQRALHRDRQEQDRQAVSPDDP